MRGVANIGFSGNAFLFFLFPECIQYLSHAEEQLKDRSDSVQSCGLCCCKYLLRNADEVWRIVE